MEFPFDRVASFIKGLYPGKEFIPLHAPVFNGNERKYVLDTIESTFVSSVGAYVDKFEEMMCHITGAKYAVAIVNGTNALHLALILAGVNAQDEVLGQSLTFIATYNALSYIGAQPVFIDIDRDTLGLSPEALELFLLKNADQRADKYCYNKVTGRRIAACVPMHTFGLPCRIDEIREICNKWNITLVEDAAESLGSYYKGIHTGLYGEIGTFSFNGNKTITSGGGGAIVTNNEALARRAKYLSTQAKVPHPWAFVHDEVGYNYRMPNLNAALACAQLEQLDGFIENKRELSALYQNEFEKLGIQYCREIDGAKSNYWLNAILLKDRNTREAFLEYMNSHGVMSRPVWELMHKLPMFMHAQRDEQVNAEWIADRLVNIPSSVRK
ncbi:LegC family aminotransferase [Mucilaginibacter calamicampi]|uniref:LegC family aminotransferase n=1 Tax=Mucilaginibacter calamicampi TaxID=1302352 RepID=A0ABW2YWQ5_9SPHI